MVSHQGHKSSNHRTMGSKDRLIDFIMYRVLTPWRFQLIVNLFLLDLALYVQTTSMSIFCVICSMWVWGFLRFAVSSGTDTTAPDVIEYGFSYVEPTENSKHSYNVPIVVLDEETDYENGYAYGVMFRTAIRKIVPKCAVCYLHDKELSDYKIPKKFRDEIQGMSDATGVKVDDFIAMCAMAERDGGCTTVCTEKLFGRNLDWLPLDISQESVVVCMHDQGLFMLTVPGLLCGPTIWTDTTIGAVNVSPQHLTLNEHGQSMLFHFRSVMESSYNEKDVLDFCRLNTPLSPYHLTFKEGNNSISIEFSDKGPRVRRPQVYNDNDIPCLDVYNFDYHGCSSQNSYYRQEIVQSSSVPKKVKEMIDLLASVQSWITCHTVVATRKFVFISVANGFSASANGGYYIRFPRSVQD
jgi:hypothetical protein